MWGHLDTVALLEAMVMEMLHMSISKGEKEQSKVLAMSAALLELMHKEKLQVVSPLTPLSKPQMPILQTCSCLVALLSTAQWRVVVPFVHGTRLLMF